MVIARVAAVAALILSLSIANTARAQSGDTQILRTPNYQITITSTCEEGVVGCDEVIYSGVNLKTGKSITLKGKDSMHLCSDGVTPCHHLGYEFHHLGTDYFVSDEGLLTVTRGKKVLLNEQGTWQ